jgi:CheY-like chemotaxis protein
VSRILVAEDSGAIRLLFRRRLEMSEHTVVEAADGRQALNLFAGSEGGEKPDLVLMDAMMPNMNGSATIEEIKNLSPETPVIVVSAINGLERSPDWQLADGHFTKPVDFDRLLTRISELTAPGRP